jgi:hypothetical protein
MFTLLLSSGEGGGGGGRLLPSHLQGLKERGDTVGEEGSIQTKTKTQTHTADKIGL